MNFLISSGSILGGMIGTLSYLYNHGEVSQATATDTIFQNSFSSFCSLFSSIVF